LQYGENKILAPKILLHFGYAIIIFVDCRPWNRANGVQKLDDGIIEVIGLTTYTLPLLQAGKYIHKNQS
jgi:hypothetical protein